MKTQIFKEQYIPNIMPLHFY